MSSSFKAESNTKVIYEEISLFFYYLFLDEKIPREKLWKCYLHWVPTSFDYKLIEYEMKMRTNRWATSLCTLARVCVWITEIFQQFFAFFETNSKPKSSLIAGRTYIVYINIIFHPLKSLAQVLCSLIFIMCEFCPLKFSVEYLFNNVWYGFCVHVYIIFLRESTL